MFCGYAASFVILARSKSWRNKTTMITGGTSSPCLGNLCGDCSHAQQACDITVQLHVHVHVMAEQITTIPILNARNRFDVLELCRTCVCPCKDVVSEVQVH